MAVTATFSPEPSDPSSWGGPRGLAQSLAVREERWRAYLRLIATGDDKALQLLYDESGSLIYGLAVKILREPMDAEEATLDVFQQVWRDAGRFDPERGGVAAWLSMLARSRSLDRARSRPNRESALPASLPEAVAKTNPEEEAALAEQCHVMRKALEFLSPEQRTAIELAFFEGLSHSEVAARLETPLGTVKTRIRLGMLKLKSFLAPYL